MQDEDVPRRDPRVGGVYRRRYRLEASIESGSGRVDAELEDDFHGFAITLVHDGGRVIDLSGDARRTPWTTCPGAFEALRGFAGQELVVDLDALGRRLDPSSQCTHWHDLVCLAIAHAAAGRGRTVLDVAVDEPRPGLRKATFRSDEQLVLDWDVDDLVVRSDGPFQDVLLLGESFRAVLAGLDPGTRNAVWLLRKGLLASYSRLYDMDLVRRPAAFGASIRASCHTFRPGVVERTERVVGATKDFTDAPDAPLGGAGLDRR